MQVVIAIENRRSTPDLKDTLVSEADDGYSHRLGRLAS